LMQDFRRPLLAAIHGNPPRCRPPAGIGAFFKTAPPSNKSRMPDLADKIVAMLAAARRPLRVNSFLARVDGYSAARLRPLLENEETIRAFIRPDDWFEHYGRPYSNERAYEQALDLWRGYHRGLAQLELPMDLPYEASPARR
jgi:hypothetical protein